MTRHGALRRDPGAETGGTTGQGADRRAAKPEGARQVEASRHDAEGRAMARPGARAIPRRGLERRR